MDDYERIEERVACEGTGTGDDSTGRPSLVRTTFLALAVLLALTGCGNGSDAGSSGSTSLTITVVADDGATPKVMTLKCDPTGGNHPQPAQACGVLAKAGATVFNRCRRARCARCCTADLRRQS